ncbi:MAG: YfhO family protein [bacterium]
MKLPFKIPATFKPYYPYIYILLSIIVFFAPLIFTSSNYFIGDTYTQFYPWKFFLQHSLQSGSAPFWNSLISSGVPFAADMQKGVFYPLSIFFVFFGFSTALKIYIIIHFLIMGFSAFALMRKFGYSILPSYAAVIVFIFNTFTLSKISFLSALGSYSLIPLILLFLLNFISKKEVTYLILFILSFSLSILAGHLPTIIYTFILAFFFLIFEISNKNVKFTQKKAIGSILLFLFSIFCIILLALPQLGLFKELLNLTSIGTASTYSTTATSMSFKDLWTFIMPAGINGFATLFPTDYIFYATGIMNYFSVTAIFLIFLSFMYPKTRLYKFSIFLIVFAIIMALGKNTPVYSLFFAFLPFFSHLQNPGFAITLFVLPCSVITAFTVEHLLSLPPAQVPQIDKLPAAAFEAKKVFRILIYIIISFTVILLLILFNKNLIVSKYNLTPQIHENLLKGLFVFILIFSSNVLLYFFSVKNKISNTFYIFTLLFILFFEFSYFVSGMNPLISDSIYKNGPMQFDTTSLIRTSNYRFLHFDNNNTLKTLNTGNILLEAQTNYLSSLPLDTGMLYGFNNADSNYTSEPKAYTAYLNNISNNGILFDLEKLNILNVKYIITLNELNNHDLQKVYNGNIMVYKNNKVLPVFYTSSSKNNPNLIVGQYSWSRKSEFNFDSYSIEMSVEKPGYFIFSNNYFPGWTAYVDNKTSVIEKCFGIFMGIKVAKGSHQILFKYSPTNLKLYYMLYLFTILSFLLFGSFWIISVLPRKRNP